jgi:ESS family glutamate:Na+ symporter
MDGLKGYLFSLCLLSLFLLVGKLCRVKIKTFQRLFLPSSIVAGFIALALGPFGLELLPPWILEHWGEIPGVLINIVFAGLFLGVPLPGLRKIWNTGGPLFCYGVVTGAGQYFCALLLTVLVLTPLFGVPHIFATILEIGFSGGHGTAAGMTPVFDTLNFPAGGALAQMSATVGIIIAVVGGIVLINIAIRRGYCAYLNEEKGIPKYKKIGLIPKPKRFSIATATVATEAIEPLTFHFAIIAIAILIGWGMLSVIQPLHSHLSGFPLFPLAMLGGLLVQGMSQPFNIHKYFDRDTFDRIMGFSVDVLVIAAIASIRLDLFLQNLWPFMALMVVGILWLAFATMVIAPRMLPTFWFEKGITEYGMQSGVTAIGLLLLRLVDPMYKTDTAAAFGLKQMVYTLMLGGGLLTATAPFFIIALGGFGSIAVAGGAMVAALALSFFSGWTRRNPSLKFTGQ